MIDLNKWQKHYWVTETRFYQAELKQDIFQNWIVERYWSGLDKRGGRLLVHVTDSYQEASKIIQDIKKRRIARGYQQR